MTRENKAYLAGFFDADGCITASFSEESRIRVTARIAGRDDALPLELEFLYGGHFGQEEKGTSIGEGKFWVWGVGGQRLIRFLEDIMPYLRLKRRRAELALEIAKTAGYGLSIETKLHRTSMALEICLLTQVGLSHPKETKTIKRLRRAIRKYNEDRTGTIRERQMSQKF